MPKYRKFLSAVFLLCLTAGMASAAPAEKKNKLPILESEDALELAYQHNPVLRASAERIEQARQQIARARADKLPHLYAQLAGEWQGKEGRMPAYGNTYGVNPVTGKPGLTGKTAGYSVNSFDEAYRAALGVKWLLFSNGAVENLVASRKMAYRGVKVKEIRTGQAVENAVLLSYYKLQRARAKLTVAKEVLSLIREHLEQVNYFYKYGVVAKDEVLRVEVEASNGELNVISAKNAVDVMWRALERAVGTPLRTAYAMPEPQMRPDKMGVPRWNSGNFYFRRPELAALDYARSAALYGADAAGASDGPKVFANAEAFNEGRDFWPDDRDTWKVGVALQWDFYDGGKNSARKKELKSKARELDAQIEDVKNQIALEVSSAQLNYESAQQRISVAVHQVESAREDYRMALMRYKANVGTNLDVLDARTALERARTQLVDAVYDMKSGRAELEFALGYSSRYMLSEKEIEKAMKRK